MHFNVIDFATSTVERSSCYIATICEDLIQLNSVLQMRNALLLGACFLLQLIAGECSAPGDEDELCTVTSTKTRIVAPEYEPYVRPLMDTRYYKKLLESGGRWQSISVDGDRYTVRQCAIVSSAIYMQCSSILLKFRSIQCNVIL